MVHKSIWTLGLVSMFTDISSEMINGLLPVYLVTILGANIAIIGLIEGIAEATASIARIYSGTLSDWLGKRKILAIIGYGLSALSRPIFPLAPNIEWIMAAKFLDKMGKGVRTAPRDALIADLVQDGNRGASYGLRQSLDTIGAFVGPIIGILLMYLTMQNFKLIFWLALIPAIISLLLIIFAVKESEGKQSSEKINFGLHFKDMKNLGNHLWMVILMASVFTLARFSEAFLVLRAQNIGLSNVWIPAVLALMSIVYAISAYPIGVLSDKIGKGAILAIGISLLIIADLILAFTHKIEYAAFAIALWGLHMGCTQGAFATMVSQTAKENLRGTAFGFYYLFTGIFAFIASLIAGLLWENYGAKTTFIAGSIFAAFALILWLGFWRVHYKNNDTNLFAQK